MTDYFEDVTDNDEVRQGDLIRRFKGTIPDGEWGFVLTADCDIAQGKAGDRFTYIEILPAATYLEDVWAPAQLKRWVSRQSKTAAEQLGGIMRRSDLSLPLTGEALARWLTERTDSEVAASVNKTGNPLDKKLSVSIAALRVALDPTTRQHVLDRFLRVREILGDSLEQRRRTVREAFDGERGFPDYFLLPELPGVTGYGFAVMLRSFRSVVAGDIFLTPVDAQIEGRHNTFYRIGRLNDRVRFAITQKQAFLFSRIGLPPPTKMHASRQWNFLPSRSCPMRGEIMFDALVVDSGAISALDAALIDEEWFTEFALPANTEGLRRITLGRSVYILSNEADVDSGLLVVNVGNGGVFQGQGPRRPRFERILRVALRHFDRNITLPVQWQPYHEGSRISVYAEPQGKQAWTRIYFDQAAGERLDIYAYTATNGPKSISGVNSDMTLLSEAADGLEEAIYRTESPASPVGNFGILLNERLGAQIGGAVSLDEWLRRRLKSSANELC